jgi:hypothetical protein
MMLTFLIITAMGLFIAGTVTRCRNARETRRALEQVRLNSRAGGRIPILMPVCGRPHYLRQVLDGLSQVKDIDRALLVISQDGRDPEVSALISAIAFTEVMIIRHARPFLGIFTFFWDSLHAVSANIRFLLDFAFEGLGAPYAIVLEDDLIPAPEFFRYFSWASRHILSDERVLSVTGFNLHSRISPEQDYDPRDRPYDMIENREKGQPKFTGWSWAITGAMWRRIRKDWSLLSWDIGLDKTQGKLGLVSYKPALGRVKNIGMQGGINFTEAEENPKWTGVTISEKVHPYERAPFLLTEDPVLPPFCDLPPARPIPNERKRTRGRRLWLLVVAAAAAAVELILLGRS